LTRGQAPLILVLKFHGKHDVFVSKLDSSGNFMWAQRLGCSSLDEAFSIAVDALGRVYTTGYFVGTVDFDPGVPAPITLLPPALLIFLYQK
jgi:hypothetical protein